MITLIAWILVVAFSIVGAALIGAVIGAWFRARDRARGIALETQAEDDRRITDHHLRLVAGDVAASLMDAVEERDEKLVARTSAAMRSVVRDEMPMILNAVLDERGRKP